MRPPLFVTSAESIPQLAKSIHDRLVASATAINAPLMRACEKSGRSFAGGRFIGAVVGEKHRELRIIGNSLTTSCTMYWLAEAHMRTQAECADPIAKIARAFDALLLTLAEADDLGLRSDVASKLRPDAPEEGLGEYAAMLGTLGKWRGAFAQAEVKHRPGSGGRPDSSHLWKLYGDLARRFHEVTGMAPGDHRGKTGCFSLYVKAVLCAIEVTGLDDATIEKHLRERFG